MAKLMPCNGGFGRMGRGVLGGGDSALQGATIKQHEQQGGSAHHGRDDAGCAGAEALDEHAADERGNELTDAVERLC